MEVGGGWGLSGGNYLRVDSHGGKTSVDISREFVDACEEMRLR